MVIFYKIWKKQTKIDLNIQKMTNHQPSPIEKALSSMKILLL